MDRKQTRAVVRYTGHVQGVGFRMTAVRVAKGLCIDGSVCNQPDGSVLMDVQGSPPDINELLSRIATAMSGKIDEVEVANHQAGDLDRGFRISG